MYVVAYNLALVIAIPFVLTIVTVSPFGQQEQSDETPTSQDVPSFVILFFTLLLIWILMIGRMLYLIKKGRYRLSTGF